MLLYLFSGQNNLTLWNDTYEEEKSNASAGSSSSLATPSVSTSSSLASSQPQPSQARVRQLQAGQMGAVSPSKALPLSISVPHQASPNKFIPIRSQADDEALSLKSGKVDSSDFLKSLGADRRRMDSEESSSSQENSFLAMLNKMQPKKAPREEEEVDMSQTMMDVSMFHHNQEDSEEETDKVDSGNFLAGLVTSGMDRTLVGGGMDMNSVGGRLERTKVGGGMDMTLAVGGMDMTRNGGGVDVTRVGRVNMDMTTVDVMDMTGGSGMYDVTRPGTSLDVTKPGQSGMDLTKIGGSNMEMTRIGVFNMDITKVDGPNMEMTRVSGNDMNTTRADDGMEMTGAVGNVLQSRVFYEEDDETMEVTKVEESNDLTRKEEPSDNDDGREMTRGIGQMELTKIGGGRMEMTNIGGSSMEITRGVTNMEMTKIGGGMDTTRKEETIGDDDGMEMTKSVGQTELTKMGEGRMEMTNIGGSNMEMTRGVINMEMTKIGGGMDMTRKEETLDDDDGMEMTRGVSQMELTKMGRGQMEMTKIGGGMDMTRLGGAMEMTTDVRRLVSEKEEDINTSQGSDSVFVNNSMMAEFRAAVSTATSVTSQPRIEDLPGSEPTSAETSSTAEADFGGGATATVKFSTLSLANNTLMLPRKESEEDEMTSCPVQFFSYDPAKPINDNVEENPVKAADVSTRPSILKTGEMSRNEQTEPSSLQNCKESAVTVPSTESLIPSSAEQSRATDESGWETMHSMIGLPPVTEPSLTPVIRISSVQTSRRSSRPSIKSIGEDKTPEKTTCLGGLMMQRSKQFSDPDVSVFAPGEESTRAFKLLAPSLSEARTTVGLSIAEDSPEVVVRKLVSKPNLDLGDITTFSPDMEYESTRALHSVLPRVARQPQHISDIAEAEEVSRRSLLSSNTEMVDVTRPGSRLGQQPPSSSPMLPGVNVTAAPGDCECHDILGGHQDHHQEPCLTQPKTGESHPLGEREDSPPKRMRLEDDEDMLHQRSSLRNCLRDPQQREDSNILELETSSRVDSQESPSEQTPMVTEDTELKETQIVQEQSVPKSSPMAGASVEPQQEIFSEDVNTSPSKSSVTMKTTTGEEIENISPKFKETRSDMEIEDSQKSNELNSLKSVPVSVPEEEVPVKEIEMTIFEDLRTKHAAAGKKEWELVRHNDKLAAFGFLEKSLLLVLTLGDKLEPKRSRKSLGRIVHHWSIRNIKMISTHRGNGTGEEDPDDDIMDTGKQSTSSRLNYFDYFYT